MDRTHPEDVIRTIGEMCGVQPGLTEIDLEFPLMSVDDVQHLCVNLSKKKWNFSSRGKTIIASYWGNND